MFGFRKNPEPAVEPAPEPAMLAASVASDRYVTEPPGDGNALRLFSGEWVSRVPQLGLNPDGPNLFDDDRMKWAINVLGLTSGSVLELGPLEGGHSYMLAKAGATVRAIEGNERAFLKCLVLKNALQMDGVRFELGDFVPYLAATEDRFDAVVASGVLYHMTKPLEVLENLGRLSDKLFLWTHYYDAELLTDNSARSMFSETPETTAMGGVRRNYPALTISDGQYCGGSDTWAVWLRRETILSKLRDMGFTNLAIAFEEPLHPNGPSFAICASR